MEAQKLDNMSDVTADDIPDTVRQVIIDQVYRQSGIALNNLKCNLVDTRLRRRLRDLQITNPAAYPAYIKAHNDEVFHLVDAFTTNETRFFRTPSLWDYLKNSFLTDCANDKSSRKVNLWSAACSTGEEAYSLAILCEEVYAGAGKRMLPAIDATDISQKVLEKARSGCYGGRSIRQLKHSQNDVIQRHFTAAEDNQYHIRAAMRKRVNFARHNLMKDTGKRNHYDLVLLRNVLIYFTQKDQITIVNNVLRSMKSGAFLAIGESESLSFTDVELEYIQPFLYRRPAHG